MKNIVLMLTGLLLGATSFSQSAIYNEQFGEKTKWPVDGWHRVWGSNESTNQGYFQTKAGLYYSPEITISWESEDQYKIEFSYNNTVQNRKGVANTLVFSLVEGVDRNGNEFGQKLNSIATFKSTKGFNTYSFLIDKRKWSASSLRLKFEFNGGNHHSVSQLDKITVKGLRTDNPIAKFSSPSIYITKGDAIRFNNRSTGSPTEYNWSITPTENVKHVGESNASATTPTIQFTEVGVYTVSLTATNASGTNTMTKNDYITVGCKSQSKNAYTGHISSVKINKTDYKSSNEGYLNNSSRIINIKSTRIISLEVNYENIKFNSAKDAGIYIYAWFDWDGDGVFDQPAYELLASTDKKIKEGEAKLNVDIPEDQTSGYVAMRIKLAGTTADVQDACSDISNGEIEDYMINIEEKTNTDQIGYSMNWLGGYGLSKKPILTAANNALTIEGWFKCTNPEGNVALMGQDGDLTVSIVNNMLVVDTEAGVSTSAPWLYTNNWTHIAVTTDGNLLTLMINGENAGEQKHDQALFSKPHSNFGLAGGITKASTQLTNFIGEMDEVRIWSVSRSIDEINEYMHKTVGSDANGLLSYYQMNDNRIGNNRCRDWTGGNHLTIKNRKAEYTDISGVPFVWIGSENNDFFNPANWSWNSSEIPTRHSDIIVASGKSIRVPSGSTTAECANLTLMPGAALILEDGTTLSITDSLNIINTTDDIATINNKGFINIGNNKTKITWKYPPKRYYYIGPGVDGAKAGDYGQLSGTATAALYKYTNKWVKVTNVAEEMGKSLEGYTVSFKDTATVSLIGNFNGESLTRDIPAGWSLVANPYHAFLDITNITGVSFGNSVKTVYIPTNLNEDVRGFATFNAETNIGVNGGERLIAPGQSFWVYSPSPTTFSINSNATSTGSGKLKSSNFNINDILKVEIENETATDEIAIAFKENYETLSESKDSQKKLDGGKVLPQLYTLKDQVMLAINTMPSIQESEQIQIPLGIKVGAEGYGKLSITTSNIKDFLPNIDVELIDQTTGEIINLRVIDRFDFESESGNFTDRFLLRFTPQKETVSTDVEDLVVSTKPITIIAQGNQVTVRVDQNQVVGGVKVSAYSLKGERLVSESFEETEYSFTINGATGYYAIKVNGKNKEGKTVNEGIMLVIKSK